MFAVSTRGDCGRGSQDAVEDIEAALNVEHVCAVPVTCTFLSLCMIEKLKELEVVL